MSDNNKKIPSQEEIKHIFNETYNVFYRKWKDISNPDDWVSLMQDMHEIDHKYNCELCRHILVDLIECIEEEWRRKHNVET